MPVDDTELSKMLQSAYDELDIHNSKRSALKEFIQTCSEITKVPTQDDPTKMEVGNDRLLGTKLTEGRRQAIYTKLLADKTTLGL